MYLFERVKERLAALREDSPEKWEALVPKAVRDGLNPAMALRPYQEEAVRSFVYAFETPSLREKPAQTLFHMATGSGKTLVMASLILYLYGKGYRNFLFFVNLDNIVKKTEDNFLNAASAKFLFARKIVGADGAAVPVRRVSSFQGASPDAINLCFTTIQGLHHDMWFHKEGAPTFEDFEDGKTVLVADEAHHLAADTKKGAEAELSTSWEQTVRRIHEANPENVLLEFTATCNLKDANIRAKYESKIVFDYPLAKFRQEKWSKDVAAVRTDLPRMDRAILALLFSQWRRKVFADRRLDVKPVVLFKSKTIAESKSFFDEFAERVAHLTGEDVVRALAGGGDGEAARMAADFKARGLSADALAAELRDDFGPVHCLSVNDDKEADERQLLLNSLESPDNPYRAIFEVKKLDEGWDVLNLFDIVRLYETRDAGKGKVGKDTTAEAQLIGRGARYYPFAPPGAGAGDAHRRKFDDDAENPLRICETLLYHCQFNPRYFAELRTALVLSGIVAEKKTPVAYRVKESFKKTDLYRHGLVFANERVLASRDGVHSVPDELRTREFSVRFGTRRAATDALFGTGGGAKRTESEAATHEHRFTLGEAAAESYNVLLKAARETPFFRFDRIRRLFPHVASLRAFLSEPAYLGDVRVRVASGEETRGAEETLEACRAALREIGETLSAVRETYEGTKTFRDVPFREVFGDKTRLLSEVKEEGEGTSQAARDLPSHLRLDLSGEDWYAYNDNYGTTEEKSFVKFFHDEILPEYRKRFDTVFLVRNERQLPIFSFASGDRFEPDFLLFLRKKKGDKFEQRQIFVEPKGDHLLDTDAWKEEFLQDLRGNAKAKTKWADDGDYLIVGLPFYNRHHRMPSFRSAAAKAGDIPMEVAFPITMAAET